MKTNTVRIATLVALGMIGQYAGAANMTMSSPYMFASEQGNPDKDTVAALSANIGKFDIPVISNRTIENTKAYYVKVILTGGAVFGVEPTLTCPYSIAPLTRPAVSDVLGEGQPSVSFKLESGLMNGSVCILDAISVKLLSGAKEYGIVVTARHVTDSDPVSGSWAGSFVNFSQALQVATKLGGVTVDVRDGFGGGKEFYKPTVNPTGYTVISSGIAKIGTIYFENGNGYYKFADTPAVLKPSDIVTKMKLVVSGSPIAAITTGASTTPVQTASIFIDAASAVLANTCKVSGNEAARALLADISVSAISGSYVTIVDVLVNKAFDPPGGVGSGIDICMKVNGAMPVNKGIVTFSLEASTLANNGYSPNLTVVTPTLVNVAKNGASIKVLNLPSPTNTTDSPFLRIYNMGTANAKIKGTLYSQGTNDVANTGGGSVLGTPESVLVASLAPGAVNALDVKALAAIFGVADWPGRAWLQIESDVQSLRVQALVRSGGATGTLVNLSDRAVADNEAMCRSDYSNKCTQ